MPTARELLEQADALMRRNRSAGATADEVPAVPGRPVVPAGLSSTGLPLAATQVLAPSPRPIQREPIAPSVARTSLPVDPTDSPAIDSPLARSPLARPGELPRPDSQSVPQSPAMEAGGDAIPLLTDAVEAFADDLPVLTDAIEEIDVDMVGEKARGEPSFWLDPPQGDASVLGPAPDSVAVVPPPDLPERPPAGRDPLGLDQPASGFDPSPTMLDAAREAAEASETEAASPSAQGGEAGAALETASGASATPVGDAMASRDAVPPPATDEAAAAIDEAAAATDEATVLEPPAIDEAAVLEPASIAERSRFDPADDTELPQAAPVPQEFDAPASGAAAVPAAAAELDERRQREIAEEIRMQVLQRIDIFTDTGLREQLGERLKPLVDRASAELVDAINQHVGEILRTYVAEAIEREIESWRNRQS